jgi:hypothetical protein
LGFRHGNVDEKLRGLEEEISYLGTIPVDDNTALVPEDGNDRSYGATDNFWIQQNMASQSDRPSSRHCHLFYLPLNVPVISAELFVVSIISRFLIKLFSRI